MKESFFIYIYIKATAFIRDNELQSMVISFFYTCAIN